MKEKPVKSIALLLCIALLISAAPLFAVGTYHGGSGTSADPYRILTAAQLMQLSTHTEDYDKSFVLLADIDMDPDIPGNQTWQKAVIAPCNSNAELFDGVAFSGTFDGNGHSIKDLTFNQPNCSYVGLFGKVDTSGTILNLGVENTLVSVHLTSYGMKFIGFVAAENAGTIINSHSTGKIVKEYWENYSCVGGLIGKNTGMVFDCYTAGTICGYYLVGGLVGLNLNGYMQKCYSTCTIVEGMTKGGLVGYNEGASYISYSYATGSTAYGGSYSGGLVGRNEGYSTFATINCCYATGSGYDGGLVGYADNSIIKNSYSVGTANVGGLIADGHWDSETIDCFWDIYTSAKSSSYGGLPKYTEQMKQKQTFVDAGWDFYSTWDMVEGRTYPFFMWQDVPLENLCQNSRPFPQGDLNFDCVVNLEDFAIFSTNWLTDLR